MWYFIVAAIFWVISLATWIVIRREDEWVDIILWGTLQTLTTLLLSLLWPVVIGCLIVYGLAKLIAIVVARINR